MITLRLAPFGGFAIRAEDGRERYVQTDLDYPGVASTFGWDIADVIGAPGHSSCYHDGTDGTIDCGACGRTASEFIASARDYLYGHIGATTEDPGYFDAVPTARCGRSDPHGGHWAGRACAGNVNVVEAIDR